MPVVSPVSERLTVVGLLLLTFATGIVDAVSVLVLGHVFVANMTGNVIFLGFWFVPHSGRRHDRRHRRVRQLLGRHGVRGPVRRGTSTARSALWLTVALGAEVVVLLTLSSRRN